MRRPLIAVLWMLLIPPMVVLGAAQAGAFDGAWWAGYVVLAVAWGCGLAGLRMAGWRRSVLLGVGVAYTVVLIPALPFVALVAVCWTGPCL